MKKLILISLLFGAATVAKANDDLLNTFMCRQMTGKSLSDLKIGLVQDCNLDKPFSSSVSASAIGDSSTMTYCCHKNKAKKAE
jgi:hypothetical protein